MTHQKSQIIRTLTENDIILWDELVSISPQGSVFYYSWWIKAVTGHFKVLGYFENSKLVAGIPLYFKKKYFFTLVTMPKLTQTWGVLIEPLFGKRVKVASREIEILRVFADELSKYPIFMQSFHPNLQNWLPFYWHGFKQTSRFTYIIDDLANLEQVMKEFRENVKGDIKKAQRNGIVVEESSIDKAYPIFTKTFKRQNIKMPYPREYVWGLYRAAKEHGAGVCFTASDPAGNVHASAFLVWDEKRAYYLMGGGDPDLRNSGATSLLVWEMIKYASEKTKCFDFEGSMVEQIEHFFRAFGARQVTYNHIYKFPKVLQIISPP